MQARLVGNTPDLIFPYQPVFGGDERFKPDSIASYFDKVLFSSSSFVSLMRWVKEYNRHLEEKVSFFGIDRNIYRLQSSIDLFYFFYTLRRGKGDEGLKAICESLLLSDEKFPLKGRTLCCMPIMASRAYLPGGKRK